MLHTLQFSVLIGSAWTDTKPTHQIYLNVTNELFKIDDYVEINVHHGDKIDVICPRVESFWDTQNSEDPLYLNLFNVDFREFKTCSTSQHSKRLVRCSIPNYDKKWTTLIQDINPIPNGLEYIVNHSYYFISPTPGKASSDVEGMSGGVCITNNMRFIINVLAEPTTTIAPGTEAAKSEASENISNGLAASKTSDILESGFLKNTNMWVIALLCACLIMLMILLGVCVIFIYVKTKKEIKPKFDYSISPPPNPMSAYDHCTITRKDDEETLILTRKINNYAYRMSNYDQILPFLTPAEQYVRSTAGQPYPNPVRNAHNSDPSQMETSISDLNSYPSSNPSNPGQTSSLADDSLPKQNEFKMTKDGLTVQV